MEDKKLFTLADAVIYTGLSYYALRKMILEEKLKAVNTGGKFYISKRALDDLM